MTDHYFTAAPASATELRPIHVTLAGQSLTLTTAGGVFSPDRLDKGTAILLAEVPAPPPTGALLDLGCGWGPVAFTMALHSPDADVYAVDVNARALDLLRRNAASVGASRVIACAPDDVPAAVRFATIWSNPPIRVGKAVLHDLLRTWLPRLEPEGTAYLVVQKNLGADSLQRWIATELGMPCERHATSGGFRVLAAGHAS